jgi:hypothetical protein
MIPYRQSSQHVRALLGAAITLLCACAHKDAAAPATAPTLEDPASHAFVGSIILGRPTDHGVTASLMSDHAGDVWLEYGTQPGAYSLRSTHAALQAGVPLHLTIDGLQTGARYLYRVRTTADAGAAAVAPEEHAFRTQRPRGSEFVFTVDADPHWGETNFDSTVYTAAMGSILTDAPDFHIDLGDNFMTEKIGAANYAEAAHSVSAMRSYWGVIGPSVPTYIVIGNHEGEHGWELDGTAENLPLWAVRARQAYYPNPVPNAFYSGSTTSEPLIGVRDGYYAWEWGDALFVVLDDYWYTRLVPNQNYWNFTLGSAQFTWLERTLRGSSARFKFVFAHQLLSGINGNPRGGIEAAPYYEWGGRNADGTWGFTQQRPGWDKPIHQLFVETGVTAFFHGHDHFYDRQQLDGIVYQLVPQPSFARADGSQSATAYGYLSGEILSSSGYLRIRVSATQARVEYVKVYLPGLGTGLQTGTVAASYTLTPRN